MQLPGSNQCGVSILTSSTITDRCWERGIASVPVRTTTVVVFIGLPGTKDALPLCMRFIPGDSGWWAIRHQREMDLFCPLFSLAEVTSFAQVPSSTSLYIHCLQKTFYKPKAVMTNTIKTIFSKITQHSIQLPGHGLLISGTIPITKSTQ